MLWSSETSFNMAAAVETKMALSMICIMEDFDGSDRGAATPGMRKREQNNRLSVHVQH